MLRDYGLYLQDIIDSISQIQEYVYGMAYEDFISWVYRVPALRTILHAKVE